MKTRYLLCFAALCMGWASCQWGVPTKKQEAAATFDTLSYTYKTIKERSADCGNKPDSVCAVVQIKYPVFNGQKKLNDSVTRKLLSLFAWDGKPDTSVAQMSKSFMKNYTDFKKDNARLAQYYKLNSHAVVVTQDSSLTTLEVAGDTYQGGAHGAATTTFINWDVKANHDITLNDLFANGYTDKLSAVAETIFRKNEKLSPTATLAKDYFFKNNRFALNNNFLITPVGLKFFYNQYEIKPYAAGTTTLVVPYPAIKSLLRPNTVVAKYALGK